MSDHQIKFQQLLRELFQFDCSDLDFGIYRIMNHKREVVERFISHDLPQVIADELAQGAVAEQSRVRAELEQLAVQVRKTLDPTALDAEERLKEAYHSTTIGQEYLELHARAAHGRGQEAAEATIYNHLFALFSRYYQDGDFISKRRYSKRERYAIPYNGEEVYLYWANHDQYYVKTAEHFTDYAYTAPNGVTVHFKIQAADVEQNNVKGDKRFFLPRPAAVAWDESANRLVIPFEYRPLTARELIAYGQRNQQDAIIASALTDIPRQLTLKTAEPALAALAAERRKSAEGEPVSQLEHHLRQYTRRNTSDFFIHKDLKGFLSRELDFYLKNEVLHLDELEAAGEARAEGWFQIMRVIKAIGGQIIEFLHQIEEFQKMLWEKRKFIIETQYCITVGHIAADFYPEIAACEPQWEEWKALFHIDAEQDDLLAVGQNGSERRIAFLQAHRTLVLDTRHFGPNFVDRLLASFDDLDDMTDGLLVSSENWQALNLLTEKYQGTVKCVYIDPPYNTDASAILYKNDYKDSSWLSMMSNRLNITKRILASNGIVCVAIDDEEISVLRLLLSSLYENELGIVSVRSNPAGRKTKGKLAPSHEYAVFYGVSEDSSPHSLDVSDRNRNRYPLTDEKGSFAWANFIRSGSGDKRADRPTMYYPIFVNTANFIRIPKMNWDREASDYLLLESSTDDEITIYPVVEQDGRRIEKRWHRGHERVSSELDEYRVRRSADGTVSIDFKTRMDTSALPTTWWDKNEYASANYGAAELKNLFGSKVFDFAKARRLVMDCLTVCCDPHDEATVIDFFAGSGTTGDAVIALNRRNGCIRRFILAEMGQYFDTVLLPRVKKVTFTPDWRDGKPQRMATSEEAERSPRVVKVIRLESYEDSLNNIAFDDEAGQQDIQFDDYLLQYMLHWETRHSETLLNVEQLAQPFAYRLHIHRDGQTRAQMVDIPDTFNYLLGLHVQTRRVHEDRGNRYLVYRGRVDHKQVAVIWRQIEGWSQADYERDSQFVAEHKLAEGADQVYVNGDSLIPNAQALEPLFKARMFASVEV